MIGCEKMKRRKTDFPKSMFSFFHLKSKQEEEFESEAMDFEDVDRVYVTDEHGSTIELKVEDDVNGDKAEVSTQ